MTKDTMARVVECIAKTTRYPTPLLTATADLEYDLGIDSVKRLEIVVALEEEFGLQLAAETRDPLIRTIQDIASWVDRLANPREPKPAPPQHLRHQFPSAGKNGHHYVVDEPTSHQPSPPHYTPEPHDSEVVPKAKTLSGRVALVTGSGHGVGRTTARLLAARGATVIVNSFHSREQGEQTTAEINAQGGTAVHLWGSIANPSHVDQLFAEIKQKFGQLDILVCNASDGRIGSFMKLTADDWDRAFRTNVIGHHHCAVHAAELMQTRGGGSIITMSAVGANGFIEGLGSQGVVKAAVETLTRYLACELGQFGIRVNCVAGGPVYGDLISKFPNARSTQEHWESITPDGQLCSAMDLANAIGFLVSEEAGGINGSVWMVDHGFSAMADGRPGRSARQPKQNGYALN